MKKVLGTFSGGILDEEQSQQMSGLAYTTTGKIGFPQYIRGGLFQLFRKVPFGWKIIGRIKSVCSKCNRKLYAGEENGKKFSFCKGCLKK